MAILNVRKQWNDAQIATGAESRTKVPSDSPPWGVQCWLWELQQSKQILHSALMSYSPTYPPSCPSSLAPYHSLEGILALGMGQEWGWGQVSQFSLAQVERRWAPGVAEGAWSRCPIVLWGEDCAISPGQEERTP